MTAAAVAGAAPWRCAGLLLLLASCHDDDGAARRAAEPPMTGETNDPRRASRTCRPAARRISSSMSAAAPSSPQGSATLDSVAKTTLDSQIAWLNKYPQWLVKLQGFADDSGSDSAQVALSQKRADAVMAYLAAGGVDPEPHVGQGLRQGPRGARLHRQRLQGAEPPRRHQSAQRARRAVRASDPKAVSKRASLITFANLEQRVSENGGALPSVILGCAARSAVSKGNRDDVDLLSLRGAA